MWEASFRWIRARKFRAKTDEFIQDIMTTASREKNVDVSTVCMHEGGGRRKISTHKDHSLWFLEEDGRTCV